MYYVHAFKFSPGCIPVQARDVCYKSMKAARKALADKIRLHRRLGIGIFDRRPVRSVAGAGKHGITDGHWTILYNIYEAA